LLAAELVLRIFGYGFPTGALVDCEIEGKAAYCDNPKFTWRFFPPQIAREFDSLVLAADKPADSYRIVVLGGSAAKGTPDGSYSFSRILQVMLEDRHPQTGFEVVNAAIPAINSHVVVQIIDDFADHQVDLFVVYLGNNEVVGPFGAGTVFAPLSDHLAFIRLGLALRTTRLGQLFHNLFSSPDDAPKVWRGLEMFEKRRVTEDDPQLEVVYRHFRQNLEDMVDIAQTSGARLVLCTVGTNLKDNPPFASEQHPDLSAEEHFRRGLTLWSQEKFEDARTSFIRARDLDTLRFRADTEINNIIREVAESPGVLLADVERTLEYNSPQRVTGEEIFFEHVHLNFHGNYLAAAAIFLQVEQALFESTGKRPVLTEEECARRLAFTGWDRYYLTRLIVEEYLQKPPFTNQLDHSGRVGRMVQQIRELESELTPDVMQTIASQYQQAIRNRPADPWLLWKYGKFLSLGLGNYPAAVEQSQQVLKHWPHSYIVHAELGFVLSKAGKVDLAIEHSRRAIDLNPYSPTAHHNLGLVHQRQNKLEEAKKYYARAVELKPDYTESYLNHGVVLHQQGKTDEAIDFYKSALENVPDSPNIHYNLALFLLQQGHREQALAELKAAVRLKPDFAEAQRTLAAVLGGKD
jgi:Tfp pilus assembly protein PilF